MEDRIMVCGVNGLNPANASAIRSNPPSLGRSERAKATSSIPIRNRHDRIRRLVNGVMVAIQYVLGECRCLGSSVEMEEGLEGKNSQNYEINVIFSGWLSVLRICESFV